MATSTQISVWDSPKVYKHHEQQSVCHTRPKYRDGRRPKAVKVSMMSLQNTQAACLTNEASRPWWWVNRLGCCFDSDLLFVLNAEICYNLPVCLHVGVHYQSWIPLLACARGASDWRDGRVGAAPGFVWGNRRIPSAWRISRRRIHWSVPFQISKADKCKVSRPSESKCTAQFTDSVNNTVG